MALWYRSVGHGANLLLNVPPDRRGLVAESDVTRLREWAEHREQLFGRPAEATVVPGADGVLRLEVPAGTRLDHVELREDLTSGQRVTGWSVVADGRVVAQGPTIGAQRLVVLDPVAPHRLEVALTGEGAALAGATTWDTGGARVPDLPEGYLAPTTPPE